MEQPAAIDKVKETRPDILFVLGVPHEDPDVIAKSYRYST